MTDKNLHNLMTQAAETGLVFHSEKCFIKQTGISSFGNIYTPTGIKPDPAMVYDKKKMVTPQDKDKLQRFLGMLNYLFQYIPKLAEKAHSLHDHFLIPVNMVLRHWSPEILWQPNGDDLCRDMSLLLQPDQTSITGSRRVPERSGILTGSRR